MLDAGWWMLDDRRLCVRGLPLDHSYASRECPVAADCELRAGLPVSPGEPAKIGPNFAHFPESSCQTREIGLVPRLEFITIHSSPTFFRIVGTGRYWRVAIARRCCHEPVLATPGGL